MKQRNALILSGFLLLLLPILGFAGQSRVNADSGAAPQAVENSESAKATQSVTKEIWSGTKDLKWDEDPITMSASDFADITVGTKIVFDFENESGQIQLQFCTSNGTWSPYHINGNNNSMSLSSKQYIYTVTGEAVKLDMDTDETDLQMLKNNGLKLHGKDAKIMKISLEIPGEGGSEGPDDPNPPVVTENSKVLWTGNVDISGWNNAVDIPHDWKFRKGGKLQITFSGDLEEIRIQKFEANPTAGDGYLEGQGLDNDVLASTNNNVYTRTLSGAEAANLNNFDYVYKVKGSRGTVTEIKYIAPDDAEIEENKKPVVVEPIKRTAAKDGDNVLVNADGGALGEGNGLMLRQDLRYKVEDKIKFTFTGVEEGFTATLYSFNPNDAAAEAKEIMKFPVVTGRTFSMVISREIAAILNNDLTALRVNGANGTLASAVYEVPVVSSDRIIVPAGETVEVFNAVNDDPEKQGVLGTDWNDDCSMNVKMSTKYNYEVGGLVTVQFEGEWNDLDARVQIFENTYKLGEYKDGYQFDIAIIASPNQESPVNYVDADGKFTFNITPQIAGRLNNDNYVGHVKGINGTVAKITYTAPAFKVPADAVDILELKGSNYLSEPYDWGNNDIVLSSTNADWELYGRIRVYLSCDGGTDRVSTNVNECTQVEIQRKIEGDYHRPDGLYQFLVTEPTSYVEWVITRQEQIDYLSDPTSESIIKGQLGHVLGAYYLPPIDGITETPHGYKNMALDVWRDEMEPKYGVIVYFNSDNKTGNVGGSYTAGYDNIKSLDSRDVVYVVYRAINGEGEAPSITTNGGTIPLSGAIVSGPDANGYYSAEYHLNSAEAEGIKEGGLEIVTNNENTSVWTVSIVSFEPGGYIFTYEPVEVKDNAVVENKVRIYGFNLDFAPYGNVNKEGYLVEGVFPEDIRLSHKDLGLTKAEGESDDDYSARNMVYTVVGVKENAFDVNAEKYKDFYDARGQYNLPNVNNLGISRKEFFAKYWPVTLPAYKEVEDGAFRRSPFGEVDIHIDDIVKECFKDSKELSKVTFSAESQESTTSMLAPSNRPVSMETQLRGTLPKYIQESAFEGTEKLTSINLPKEVELVGKNAFSGAPLKSIVLNGRKNENAGEPVDTDPMTWKEYSDAYLTDKPAGMTDEEWEYYLKHNSEDKYNNAVSIGLPYNSDASVMKIYPGAFDGMTSGTIDVTGCEVPPMCVGLDNQPYYGFRSWHHFYFIRNEKSAGTEGNTDIKYEIGNMPDELGQTGKDDATNKLTPFGKIVSGNKKPAAAPATYSSEGIQPRADESKKVKLVYGNNSKHDTQEAAQYKASPVWSLFFDQPDNSFIATGIEDVTDVESAEIVEAWTLDGVKVNPSALAPGIYLLRDANGKTRKAIVK